MLQENEFCSFPSTMKALIAGWESSFCSKMKTEQNIEVLDSEKKEVLCLSINN